MIAKIFFIEDKQENLVEMVSRILRKKIYDDIKIIPMPISIDYYRHSDSKYHSHGESYIRLLRKSLLSLNDFTIFVNPKENNTTPCYMGYEHNSDQSYFTKYVEVIDNEISALFPAVALVNRMVLLPKNLMAVLEKEKFKDIEFDYIFKPVNLQGAKFVDFFNEDELNNEIEKMEGQLKNELRQYYNRYIQQIKVPNPKLGQLFRLLDIQEDYLKKHENEFRTKNLNFQTVIKNDTIKEKQPSTAIIRLYKKTKKSLGKVYLNLKGPQHAMDNFNKTLEFNSTEEEFEDISFQIIPQTIPYCPVEMTLELEDSDLGYNVFPIPLLLKVE